MDSSGVAVVINAMRNMKAIGGHLMLTGIGKQPMKVFKAAGIDKIIEIREVTI
jgi:stage II sporulation protein AA (anti-sigma F factor antagonist)